MIKYEKISELEISKFFPKLIKNYFIKTIKKLLELYDINKFQFSELNFAFLNTIHQKLKTTELLYLTNHKTVF